MPITGGAVGTNKVSLTSENSKEETKKNKSIIIDGTTAGAIDISHKDYTYNTTNELID
jgi:hypothetical protein